MNTYISNKKCPLEDCDKEENVAATGLLHEDYKKFRPMSRIRPVTKRRL